MAITSIGAVTFNKERTVRKKGWWQGVECKGKPDQFWNINCLKKKNLKKIQQQHTAVLPQYVLRVCKQWQGNPRKVFSWPAGTGLFWAQLEEYLIWPPLFLKKKNNYNNTNDNPVPSILKALNSQGLFWTWKVESPPNMLNSDEKLVVSWCACTGNGPSALKERPLEPFYVLHEWHSLWFTLSNDAFHQYDFFFFNLSGDPYTQLETRSDLCIKNTASYWKFTSLAKKTNTYVLLPVRSKVKMAQLKQRMYFL